MTRTAKTFSLSGADPNYFAAAKIYGYNSISKLDKSVVRATPQLSE